VVDDAIVVKEKSCGTSRAGMPRLQATLLGVREVGFTVLSMSLSLIAVFIPILLMGDRRPALSRFRRHALGRDSVSISCR